LTAGLLTLLLAGTTASVWWFLGNKDSPGPADTSRQVEVPTTRDTGKAILATPFRLTTPEPLVVRAGQQTPAVARIRHSRATAPVELSFVKLPPGVELKQTSEGADGETAVVAVTAARKSVAGTYPVTIKARSGDQEKELVWEVRVDPYLPPQAEAAPNAMLVSDIDGESYYNRIVVTPASGSATEFVLVPRKRPTDVPTFYIMADKVTVKEFQEFTAANPGMVRDDGWTKGGRADGKDTRNIDVRHPVLRVKVADAVQFAQWLGGKLPTIQQWDQAAGRYEQSTGEGPYRGTWSEKDARDIAVNRAKDGPLPVGASERDVSWCGCRDMAGNGQEWTRNIAGQGDRLVPLEQPAANDRVLLRGRSYAATDPLHFSDLQDAFTIGHFYGAASHHTGFRVVIEL
jgi:formylglycine-generating enzyme required for sulfatase activity